VSALRCVGPAPRFVAAAAQRRQQHKTLGTTMTAASNPTKAVHWKNFRRGAQK